jgi:hypothetical protein
LRIVLFGEDRPRDLLGLVCVSDETWVGKTLLARFIARAVGLDDARVVVHLPHRPVGDILGRVDQRGERRFIPASLPSQPLAVFEEIDKADHAMLARYLELQGLLLMVHRGVDVGQAAGVELPYRYEMLGGSTHRASRPSSRPRSSSP